MQHLTDTEMEQVCGGNGLGFSNWQYWLVTTTFLDRPFFSSQSQPPVDTSRFRLVRVAKS